MSDGSPNFTRRETRETHLTGVRQPQVRPSVRIPDGASGSVRGKGSHGAFDGGT